MGRELFIDVSYNKVIVTNLIRMWVFQTGRIRIIFFRIRNSPENRARTLDFPQGKGSDFLVYILYFLVERKVMRLSALGSKFSIIVPKELLSI